jgi:uncharacterized SAM-binding protein YcdF (DUF218 family)
MDLFLSKLLPMLVYPTGLAALLLVAALIWRKRARIQTACIALALTLLLGFGNEWVSFTLARSLEWRHLPSGDLPTADAIVLLGGGTKAQLPPRPTSEVSEAGDRMIYAAHLYHAGKAPVIIVSGGFIEFFGSTVPESEAMTELLVALGVPEAAIIQEDRARNTYENALYVKEIVAARGDEELLLVTSAMHMPRSMAIFVKQGLQVTAAPTDFQTTRAVEGRTVAVGWDGLLLQALPSAERLDLSTRVLREYIGLLVYGARGWL